MKNFKAFIQRCAVFWLAIILLPAAAPYTNASQTGVIPQAGMLLSQIDFGDEIDLHSVVNQDGQVTVCLNVSLDTLVEGSGLEVERLTELVRMALTQVAWQSLSVQAYDAVREQCYPLTSFLPKQASISYTPEFTAPASSQSVQSLNGAAGSLSGKTVYISAGHGWNWTTYGWRTQRIVYEGFIEDHNNAEVVDQYLIPYLENAGAKVIPVRERDWNLARDIADNDELSPTYTETGTWKTSDLSGYNGGSYRYATTVNTTATSVATWKLAVSTPGEYAVYAWVKPGINRAPDAHYVIHHAGGQTSVTLDQRKGPETWRYLGTYPFYAGQATVTLDNASSSPSVAAVIADAIRLGGGAFDSLDGLYETAPDAPYPTSAANEPFWEMGAYYYSQWMGMDPAIWSYFNDVVSRPLFARWNHAGTGDDAVYISWHSNGWKGVTRGTESYVHNNETCDRTIGSLELQAAVHNELVKDIRAGWDASWTDRGKKQANLGEVRMLCEDNPAGREIPGVLLEIAFHDHPDDANALKDPRFNQLSARAVYQGIVNYFEVRDSVNLTLLPEPPTHLRVTNNGSNQILVSWQPGLTDGIGLRGDSATAYRVYVSSDGFAWQSPIQVSQTSYTFTNLNLGDVVYVKVTALNAGGESFPTEVLGARVGETQLLIVNDFDELTRHNLVQENDPIMGVNRRILLDLMNTQDYVVHHGNAVGSFSGWDSTSDEAATGGLLNIQNYQIVDWLLGEASSLGSGSLNSTERALLNTFLADGRGLFISGSEFAWDLDYLGLDPAFLNNKLHADFVADDAQTYVVHPTSGGIFTGIPDFSFNAPNEYDANYPDVITPLTGAVPALSYVGGAGGTAAIQYQGASYRLLVMGFPFEVIQPDKRAPVMSAVLDFLGTRVTDTVIDQPADSSYFNITPAFSGQAVGEALTRVDVRVHNVSTNLYWNGTSWGAETWVMASGTANWAYILPELSEGVYTLGARAQGEIVDETPDAVTVHIDKTAPYTTTALNPAHNITQTSPVVVFQWLAPIGDASPLHYHLEIDGEVREVTGLSYTTGLGNGLHTWRITAVDAAGNQGPWNSQRVFTIDALTFYLPILMH